MSQRVDIATGVDSTTSKTADSSIGERRRSSRLHPPYTTDGIDVSVAPRRRQQNINVKIKNEIANEDESYAENDDNGKDGGASPALYSFGGRQFKSYQEMVQAKRERNQQVLEESGLLSVMRNVKVEKLKTAAIVKSARTQLIKKRKADDLPQEKRKSNRLQGIESDGKYIDEERNGQVSVASETGLNGTPTLFISNNNREDKRHRFKAVDPGEDSSVQEALTFVHTILLTPLGTTASTSSSAFKLEEPTLTTKKSPRSVIVTNDENQKTVEPMKVAAMEADSVVSMEKTLSLSSREIHVAKVCPERIYSMAMHPSSSQVIACAGDKVGNVGIWNVTHASSLNDATTSNHSGVYLFRAHQSSVNCVQWTPDGSCLFSSSYDGSVRWFDAKAEISTEIFATFDDSNDSHRTKLGFGLDTGSKFWTQYGCLDHRFTGQKCFFLSTSTGSALHVDLRANERFTFHEQLSVKKINTLCLHPNGFSLVSAGLDNTVSLWDLRKMGDGKRLRSGGGQNQTLQSIAAYNCGKSVNSAFYSASGRYLVSTTMANKLDIFDDIHLSKVEEESRKVSLSQSAALKPFRSIVHDNMTGRWLTTFHAVCHPQTDLFAVGSMQKPRRIDLLDPCLAELNDSSRNASSASMSALSGDDLTAIISRFAFHPRTDRLVLAGGNSSGRVTVVM